MPALKELRRLNNLSQEALSRRSGIARETISRFENGRETPTPNSIIKLAKALRVKPTQIQFSDKLQGPHSPNNAKKRIPQKEHLELFLCALDNAILDRLQYVDNRTILKYFGDKKISEYIKNVRFQNNIRHRR